MTAQDLVAAVQGMVDATAAEALAWVNERHKHLVGASRWLMEEVTIASTVSGTQAYAIPDTVVDIEQVEVGSGQDRYGRVSTQELFDLNSGQAYLDFQHGSSGVFAPQYSSTGGKQLALYPTPSTSGDAIVALAAVLPPDLATDGSSEPLVPVDFHEPLKKGAIAVGLEVKGEQIQEASAFSQAFESAVQELRRRRNLRVGRGTVEIRVTGYHF